MSLILGDRAVVLGAGMAGLLTARVLADRYRQVVVIERDPVAAIGQARKGVPQGRHAHALLARGQRILEDLFPGLQQELTASGVLSCDLAGNIRWYFNGRPLKQQESGLLSVSATRPQLEGHVRQRVTSMPNVELRDLTVVNGLQLTDDGSRVTGVRVTGVAGDAEPEVLTADLVIDACGRGSRTPAWLEEMGYPRPAEERVVIDLAYTTRLFKLGSDPYGADLSINSVAHPGNPRGAFFARLDKDVAMLSLTGLLGDHPPREDDGFLEYAKSLDAKEIYQTVKDCVPVDDAVTFHVPASVRRRYDQLTRFPEALLVVGDGTCAFNPVYGQGMTVAAMQAVALAEHLDRGPARPIDFFQECKPIVDVPWDISAGGDLAFPGVQGKRTVKGRMGNAYISKLHTAAQSDGRFTAAFFRVAGLVDRPDALMRPGLVLGVLRAVRASRKR
ncbi:MAG TPA: FAD-dependent monooxygenase [Jatrophihabitans sp.]|jgi:2-polyprenyl-6-methoxyphenol hydroxylase-like FAD-dependent oxidoreductase|uniref:FAD-dependent oxidoreductase n=1 Tax=Jatrophihabitans sp. TaxID=1932789 RepID=UPI002F18CFC1